MSEYTTSATRHSVDTRASSKGKGGGLTILRRYTQEGVDPYTSVTYGKRMSVIREPDGTVVFEMKDVEVPSSWSQVATDILAQKYFRKTGVPQYADDGTPKKNPDGSAMLGPERSIRQVVHRLAGCWREWGQQYGYFATEKDAQIFYDEMVYMLLHQMAAPNSPQWFNTGLYFAYGINGPAQGHYYPDPNTGEVQSSPDAYSHPQPHACFIQPVRDDLVNPGGIMDLWIREARLFKYGSGTGTNFSSLRGTGEPLSGGGRSSGLMSWLKIGDRAAGAIKSGGTTRRAAKMIVVNADHPDIEVFINWKANEEKKVAALIAAGYPSDYEGEAYQTVSGQNANNSVRVTNKFMQAVENDEDWHLRWRTDGRICKTIKARSLWNQIADAAWSSADPGLQFDTTINDWHTCPQSGRINASNPCSEYMFLDNTACNLASLNLEHFFDAETQTFDVDSFRHAVRLWTMVLEISVLMAEYPSYEIADMSYQFRTLGLGYANIGSGVLMAAGIPYDSEEARAISAAVTAIITGESYATSAEMAAVLGSFPVYEKNKQDMLRVIRNHRRAAFNAPSDEYEKMSITPVGINPQFCPAYLLAAARESWTRALEMGEQYGYRNAQTTLLAPTGTIGLLMDCATTGVEPDFALVKFKKLAGGGYFKIINDSLPAALRTLQYSESQITDIVTYVKGTGSLHGSPGVNRGMLQQKGFTEDELNKIEEKLPGVFEIQFAFNQWTLGEPTMQRLGFSSEQYNDFNFNMLQALGCTAQEIESANQYICGTMTIEGAPHLKREHYPVFDCANKCGKSGQRFIQYMGHIKMMAAVQPFLSGAISKTINMPTEVTPEDIKQAYMASWKLCLKANALYRDGSKLSQPLSTRSKNNDTLAEHKKDGVTEDEQKDMPSFIAPNAHITISTLTDQKTVQMKDGSLLQQGRRKLPIKRSGVTIEAKIGNQKIHIRTGEYPDGTLGEVFIDMFREGAAFRSLLSCFGVAISYGLQYGVPLEKFVNKFTFTRFDPSGFTDHPNVKMCTSIIDFVFRVLAMEYLGRTDLVQIPPKGIERNRVEKLAEVVRVSEETSGVVAPAPGQKKMFDDGGLTGQLEGMMGDAPMCDSCGHITVRSGSCYRCLNCGSSMGCS